ncbi:uncharacterized protein [Parasteatoda tepidariorum]|uniref:uncharacterized protein isoform X2 n=1 Tax=Parasteatoda tepidariorum TaxID=114398 RepID=UPI0039BCC29D
MEMSSSNLYSMLIIAAILCICPANKTKSKTQKSTENGTLATYRNSCLRLQNIAKWMTVLFKLKSAWVNTTTKIMLENPLLGSNARKMRNVPNLPSIRNMKGMEAECSSLQNLQITLRGYVHFQAQLLQLKAVFGNIILQRALNTMNESVALKSQIKSFDLLNKTASSALERLKELNKFSSYAISNDDAISKSAINNIRNAPKLLSYFQAQTNDIFENLLNVTRTSNSLKQTQNLMKTGDLFKSLGRSLDNFFFH